MSNERMRSTSRSYGPGDRSRTVHVLYCNKCFISSSTYFCEPAPYQQRHHTSPALPYDDMPAFSRPPSPRPDAVRQEEALDPQDIDQITSIPKRSHQTRAISARDPKTGPSVNIKPARAAGTTIAENDLRTESDRTRRELQRYYVTLERLARQRGEQALELQQKMKTAAYSHTGTPCNFGHCDTLEPHTMTAMDPVRAGVNRSGSKSDDTALECHGQESVQSEQQDKQRLLQAPAGLDEIACLDDI